MPHELHFALPAEKILKQDPRLIGTAIIDQELEQAKISSLNLMQPPTYSITPVSPQPLLTLGVGLVAALISSVGAALLADRRRRAPPARAVPALPLPRETPPLLTPARPRRTEIIPANPR